VGIGLWSNSNLGATNIPMVGYWAKTGTNSGPESIQVNWSPAGSAAYYLTSFSGTDANVSAVNPEDVSTFRQDTNANTCTPPSPQTGSYTILANDIVLSLIGFNSTFDLPVSTSSSGPDQELMHTLLAAPAGGAEAYANIHGFNGFTGPVVALAAQGPTTTVWTWSACVNTAGNAGIYTVALKGGAGLGGSAKRKHPPYIIKNRAPTKPGIIRVSLEDYR
jgi:hypothetical protein